MRKRESQAIRKWKKEMAVELARRTRMRHKEGLELVLAKDKVETYGDVFRIFNGLSRRAKEVAACRFILRHAELGYAPRDIVKILEKKKA